jgi:hypothetical protein
MGSRQILQSSSHILGIVVNVARSSQRLSSLGAGAADMVMVLKVEVVCVCMCDDVMCNLVIVKLSERCDVCEEEGRGHFPT